MKYLRYYAEFYDRKDRKYRVEISQTAETPYTPVEVELASDPLTIEWNEVSKLDPVRGSGATLRLISMSDRQFYDMYSVDYGVIELNVYREETDRLTGMLEMKYYWSGTLDPELFSEPYAYLDRYVSELTFVDFAVLDYAKWDCEGMMTIEQAITKCVHALRIDCVGLPRVYNISTTANLSNGNLLEVKQCTISANNFYTEDEDAFTMREVLEEILRPFALQIVQRNGQLFIYDCNALCDLSPEQIDWYSDDSALEVDKVYNNAVVKYSPADIQKILEVEIDPSNIFDSFGLHKTMYGLVKDEKEPTNWFTLNWGLSGKFDKFELKNGASLFRIDPSYSGSKEAGFLWGASFPDASETAGWWPNKPFGVLQDGWIWPENPCKSIVAFDKVHIKGGDSANTTDILISLDLLFDPRSNPFENADLYINPNDTAAYDDMKKSAVYVYLPVAISLWSEEGVCKYRYSNNIKRLNHAVATPEELRDYEVRWYEVSDESEIYKYPSWLSYYEKSLAKTSALGGWISNKKVYNPGDYHDEKLTEQEERRNNGEYIPLPPEAGYLKIEILAGILLCNDFGIVLKPSAHQSRYEPTHGWLAYKDLKVRYVPKYGPDDDYENSDYEVTGYINKSAREELSIDTVIGTAGNTIMARGDILDNGGTRIVEFTRGKYKNRLEQLLIGTAYSQYATRKNVLSGTIESPERFGVLSDATIDGKYMVVSEVQNVEDATSEIKAIEVVADQYEGIEYE